MVDRLKEVRLRHTRVVAFKGGERPENKEYFMNRVTEVWWIMRQRYIAGELDTDDDPALIGQVASRAYTHESDGRIRLQSKYEMRKSPDEADALAMTFAVRRGKMRVWV